MLDSVFDYRLYNQINGSVSIIQEEGNEAMNTTEIKEKEEKSDPTAEIKNDASEQKTEAVCGCRAGNSEKK